MGTFFARITERFPALFREENFSLKEHTAFGLGGRCALALSPSSMEEFSALLAFLQGEGIPHFLLGLGADVLARDEDFEGVCVRTVRMRGLRRTEEGVFAEAGVTGGDLLRFVKKEGLGGLEFLAGIPLTVGGAAVMNAGIPASHLGEHVLSVTAASDGLRAIPQSACGFGEKTSIFGRENAVAGVLLRTERSTPEAVEKKIASFLKGREHLPKGRSAGCIFVNPAGISAGELIDRCGLKGLSVGGAFVSKVHANFIINGGGSASDVEELIALVKREVLRKTGILLREEVRRIP